MRHLWTSNGPPKSMSLHPGLRAEVPDAAPDTEAERDAERKRLGAGRSGEVWLVETEDGQAAVKVFAGDTLSNLIHYLLTGAPNPYIWNEDAIRSSYHRRKVIAALVETWFGPKLHVADAYGTSWNEESRAWELATEYIDGDPLPLLHPFRDANPSLALLRDVILEPLQERLIEAGVDGAVWQAGRGNPVGLNNFLYVPDEETGEARYAFIDVESGVPALFPLNPLELFRFYLPRAFHHGHAMFDDIEIDQLRAYLDTHGGDVREAIGEERWEQLHEHIEKLDHHQQRWWSQPRAERGIEYQWRKGRLTDQQAEYFRRHRLQWWAREIARAAFRVLTLFGIRLPAKIGGWILSIDVPEVFRNIGRFVSSQEYRTNIGRKYVRGRIREWRKRGQLADPDARTLLGELRRDRASAYLSDFGAHLGMKATFQLLEFTLFAALVAAGVLPVWFIPVVIALDGLIYRTAYTLYRMAREAVARRPLPWVALLVGFLPLLGTLAFPAQMIYSAKEQREHIARFILYDTFTRLGVKLPIWGGKDTLTEHTFNQWAHRVVRRSSARSAIHTQDVRADAV
jgi:hypothetical protein